MIFMTIRILVMNTIMMISIRMISNSAGLLMGCWTAGLLDCWTAALLDFRTSGLLGC